MKIKHAVSTLILLLLCPSAVLADTLSGVVVRVVAPYILLKTDSGHETVRVLDGASLGNMDSLSHIKSGGDRVEIEWTGENRRVKLASRVTRLPNYTAYPALEVPAEQAATWHDESGPDRHLMVDVRTTDEWEEGHVLRSLTVPFTPSSGLYSPYPGDRKQALILYGGSAQDDLVQRAARAAINAQYGKVRVYNGGVDDWSKRGKPLGITAAGTKRRLDRGEPLLVVDIRGADEWRAGHIPGSISAPPGTFSPDMLSVRNRNYPFPLLLVARSEQDALTLLSVRGWGRSYKAPIYLLERGFKAWEEAAYSVAKGGTSGTAADLLPQGEIGLDEFRDLWSKGQSRTDAVILDLRDNDDPAPSDHITIPFMELEQRMSELPKDKEIVLYCFTGTRALIALHMLKDNGYRVRFFNRTVRIGQNRELQE